jgi:hypothetical protein
LLCFPNCPSNEEANGEDDGENHTIEPPSPKQKENKEESDDESYVPGLREREDDNSSVESESDDKDDGVFNFPVFNVINAEGEQDLCEQEEFEADKRLIEVYGDTVHHNDGRHLHGGVEDDAEMCELGDRVFIFPHPMYSHPQGKVGKRLLQMYVTELKGVRARKWNSERALIFPAVILRKEPLAKRAENIRVCIERRLDKWEEGHIKELVQDTIGVAMRGQGGA